MSRPILYAGGTFDLPHSGHVAFFRRAHILGDVIVGLNTDEFAARYKRPPILNYGERRDIIASCRYVASVICNEGDEDSKPAILKSRASYVVHDDSWPPDGPDGLLAQMGLTWKWLHEYGIGLIYLPRTDGISSSEIIRRCRQSEPRERREWWERR